MMRIRLRIRQLMCLPSTCVHARRHIVDELRHHVPTLRGTAVPVSQSTAAGLAVTRCLGLALSAAKLKRVHTMPPVPAHRLAWRGMPLSLEVQRDGAPRLRLCSHSNEYVGRLRERMARAVGCAPKHLRIFLLGAACCALLCVSASAGVPNTSFRSGISITSTRPTALVDHPLLLCHV
jgi:hypothetical protein